MIKTIQHIDLSMKQLFHEPLDHIRAIMRSIRQHTPVRSFQHDTAASSDIRTGYLHGKPVKRLVITLRAPGCEWVKQNGGCVMCGHYAGTLHDTHPTVEESVQQFRKEISKYPMNEIQILSLYNSGSVLNTNELHSEALKQILFEIKRIPSIKKIVFESRAEYINNDTIQELKDILGNTITISIAIGLETSDDLKRELCINKGSSLNEITDTVTSLQGIAEVQLYILLGLPFLTESESIEDAVQSIRYAHDIGADEIHIEPITIQQHSLIPLLVDSQLFRLPSLYSVYEVLQRVLPDIQPYVSPFLHMPLPKQIPQGCSQCTDRLIHGLLQRYNIDRTPESLIYQNCDCLEIWRTYLAETDERPLPQRIIETLSAIHYGTDR